MNVATSLNSPGLVRDPSLLATTAVENNARFEEAREVRETFQQFVGETFFGQMLKAMRATTGKPAYLHGGRAEEVFRGQLDQTLAEEMTKASASKFAGPMFKQQFPELAEQLDDRGAETMTRTDDLFALRRR